ncbi:Antennal binding protein 2, partial [Operophtera brumata]
MVKSNKINLDAMVKQVEMMFPPDMKDVIVPSVIMSREAECGSDIDIWGTRMDQRAWCLFLIAVMLVGGNTMSLQQLKNTGKMLKKQCISKTGATEEKNVMCYIACVYQMSQIVTSIKQVEMMYPPELKEAAKASIDNCKDI